MISVILIASCLVGATVAVHCVGLAWMLRSLMKSCSALPTRLWPITLMLIRVALWLIVIALVEIAIWGLFYLGQGCLPDAESAFYFSGITYTSIGYGDVVLAKHWRMLGPVEGLTGLLMSGLSAGLFFAVVSRIYTSRLETGRR
jgi:hypothetical protein